MNADLPVIDISDKLRAVDRETAENSQTTADIEHAIIDGLTEVDHAYLTLTSSHLDQLQHSCELAGDGDDVVRSA